MSAKIAACVHAKNGPNCCQIAKILVAITSGKLLLCLWKILENFGNFFSYFVATVKGQEDAGVMMYRLY